MTVQFSSVTAIKVGDSFGRWTVIGLPNKSDALCRCSCGTDRLVRRGNLVRNLTRSCGCLKNELTAERAKTMNRTHGLGGTPIYACWKHMMRRCTNPKSDEYPGYGGRGINVHEPWRDAAVFAAEVQAEIGQLQPGMTLDRVNNDGHYAPGNIRWATRLGQARNRRNTWESRRAMEFAPLAEPLPRQRTKLTQEQVVELLALVSSGTSQTKAAAQFGISQAHVSRIVRDARKAAADG